MSRILGMVRTVRRRWFWLTIGLMVVCVFYCYGQTSFDRMAAEKSGTNISIVGSILVQEQPDIFDHDALVSALKKYNHDEDELLDGWGNPLILYHSNTEPPSFIVMSLGRDGTRGGCCEKFVDNLDSDLIWRDGSWLQVFTSESQ